MDIARRLHLIIDDMLGQDPRRALIAHRELKDEHLPWLEQRIVALAKRDGWSYGRMARLLGVSRQHLHRRFSTLRPATPVDHRAEQQALERMIVRMRRHGGLRSGGGDDPDEDVVPW